MEIFLWWFGLSVVVGIIASANQRAGFGYFILSLLLSPLIIGILVIGLGRPAVAAQAIAPSDAVEPASPKTHVRCPDCKELVRKDARKCRHCGTALIPSP